MLAALAFFAAAMVWLHQAHANMVAAGWRPKYTPRKVLIGYAVPLMNLIVPFEAMRELYNRSHGEGDDFAHTTAEDVTAWWTAMIVGLLVFSAMIFKFLIDAGTNLILMTPLWMEYAVFAFGSGLLLLSAFLFASLTRKITAAQAEYLPAHPVQAAEEHAAQRRMAVTVVPGRVDEPY